MAIIKKIIGKRSRVLVCGQAKNGPALSFLKNMNSFVREFNDKTKQYANKTVIVKITLFIDGTYEWTMRNTPTSLLLKELAGEKKEIKEEDLLILSEQMLDYLNTDESLKAYKVLSGTAKSASIKIIK